MVEHGPQVPPGAGSPDDEDDEARFLAGYDIRAYPRPSLAVDVAVLTVAEGSVHAVLVRRRRLPQRGRWALPGGFVRPGEAPENTVARVLRAKAGLEGVYTAQLATFGSPHRDPRGWVVSVAHYALVPADRLSPGLAAGGDGVLARLDVDDGSGGCGRVTTTGPDGELDLAFDHMTILSRTVERLRGRLWYAPDALELMPDEFTLLDLQEAYTALLGHRLDKNSFRRRILASGLVTPLGRRREGLPARPAGLFRFERRRRDA
jgi:8-oxo-dGTP diphosphatase